MTNPHKHVELIKAWADGAEIEYYSVIDKKWKPANNPAWSLDTKYRSKPRNVVKNYYMYMTSAGYIIVDNSRLHNNNISLTFDPDSGKLIDAKVINND